MAGQHGAKLPPKRYNFQEQLQMSSGVSQSASVQSILMANVAGAVATFKASKQDDKSGIDWFVQLNNGKRIGVDCKIRTVDYSKRGQDDLALETWSVIESNKAGWTRDSNKKTDYVLWLWTDTGRWCLIPFHQLCTVFNEKWQEWIGTYKNSRQQTTMNGNSYHSECVFVPRLIVWRAIYDKFGGKLK